MTLVKSFDLHPWLSWMRGLFWFWESQMAVTLRSFMKETGRCWMRLPVRLRTASPEMWSSSAGSAVRWFLWALRIRRAAHDPTSWGVMYV